MGVDLDKLPSRNDLNKMLNQQIETPNDQKKSYGLIWEIDNQPIGHCNVNKITFGFEAYMHLHLWENSNRKKGMGTELVKKSIPYFFKNLQLEQLYCEPYSLNPAPNKTLEKVGFTFIKKYKTIPGSLNFEQTVNLWKMSREQYDLLLI